MFLRKEIVDRFSEKITDFNSKETFENTSVFWRERHFLSLGCLND